MHLYFYKLEISSQKMFNVRSVGSPDLMTSWISILCCVRHLSWISNFPLVLIVNTSICLCDNLQLVTTTSEHRKKNLEFTTCEHHFPHVTKTIYELWCGDHGEDHMCRMQHYTQHWLVEWHEECVFILIISVK